MGGREEDFSLTYSPQGGVHNLFDRYVRVLWVEEKFLHRFPSILSILFMCDKRNIGKES